MRKLITAAIVLIGCGSVDSNFVERCEKAQKLQKVAVAQSGMASGATDALLNYSCKDLVNRYGATCKEQVKELEKDQRDEFYASCIMSENTKAVVLEMIK